ncbi:hypothetical protein HH310_30960 [Actinoplanes sp. TBRC 11911]|uniref:hypothetical protein n=1 Tax=Actinoplanes sp. TBRC 11911 TaxID=2729386 RepID=UPI00145EBEB1|nr:hypothetical protein [Actinoplanes sp. TBRC 11911]NMO55593.1 hypothetical protein [Actinoplanes sp. TBRC 11911]
MTLRMYLAAHMQKAIDDAVRHPMDVDIDFWSRFMGWVPLSMRPPPTGPAAQQPARGEVQDCETHVTIPCRVIGAGRA